MASKKKRRKRLRKDETSTAKRVLKFGGTVLAIGAGASLFSRSNLFRKSSELIPALVDTKNTFRKSLLNKKGTAMDYYNAFNKSIGKNGQVFKETLEKQKGRNWNPSTAKRTNLLGRVKNIEQSSRNKLANEFKLKHLLEIRENAVKSLLNDPDYKDKYSEEAITNLVHETVEKYKSISDQYGNVSTDFYKRKQQMYGFSDKDLEDIVKQVTGTVRAQTGKKQDYIIRQSLDNFSEKTKQIQYEALKKRTRKNQLINKVGQKLGIKNLDDIILGHHSVTVEELLKELEDENGQIKLDSDKFNDIIKNKLNIKGKERDKFLNTLQKIQELNKDGEYNDVIIDDFLRAKKNKDGSLEFIDITRTMEVFEKYRSEFESSIVGRILVKGIDARGMRNAPNAYMLMPGLKSASAHLDDDAVDGIMQKAKYVINNTAYEIITGDDGTYDIDLSKPLKTGVSINMNHGSLSGALKNLLGSNKTDPLSSRNSLFQRLDIGQTGRPNIFERVHQWFNKFSNPDWGRNKLNRVQYFVLGEGTVEEKLEAIAQDLGDGASIIDAMARLSEDFEGINKMFKTKASQTVVSDDTIAAFRDTLNEIIANEPRYKNFESEKLLNIFDLILSDDRTEDLFDEILRLTTDGKLDIKSKSLTRLLDRYQENAVETLELLAIESSSSKKIPVLGMEFPTTNVIDSGGILRRELIKELTIEDDWMEFITSNMEMSSHQLEAYELIKQWQKWETATTVPDELNAFTSLFGTNGAMDRYINNMSSADAISFHTLTESFKAEYDFFHKGSFEGLHEDYSSEYNNYDLVSKPIGMDLIKNANNFTKWKAAVKQFNAGRDDLENISTATLLVQYMFDRLSNGVEEAGLALSDASTSSPLATMKNLMMKRVFPVMLTFTALDYLNDLSQDITGVGIDGAIANVAANFDVGFRKFAYNTGIGQALDWVKRTSVIGEYWTGSTDFQTAEERAEWYRDGYTPVRKSRYWGFGSSSEFRGGDISFFQPNYLRRIHSDYKDKVLYGSNSEKWAHSIVPTPTHPFSTIRYLMDPYWLEKKHIDDAPTPLTGKMFSEGSLWGVILNPTVGEIIKPQKMLPEIKKRMTRKGHDSKAIIRNINERIRRKRSEYDDMLIVNGTDIRNATYVPYGNATPGTITVTGGRIRGIDYMENVQDLGIYAPPDGTMYTDQASQGFGGGSFGGYGGSPSGQKTEYPTAAKKLVSSFIGELNSNQELSKGIIQSLNNAIKSRGKQVGSVSYRTPDSTNKGTYVYNNLINEYNNYIDTYYNDKYIPDLLDNNRYKSWAQDAVHSAKNISGIYGFVGEQVFGGDSLTYRYESADSYTSFSRGFWDAGIGGLGGGMMEIARRFFPSTDKSRIDYNPLVNNMPEWLPEKFRTGVAWTKVTKGEMRLPGKGYEALNDLHPDEFADENGYGSFDKFKILADVAPNSSEYKIWHNIVKHHITDPELKQEIKEIEARTKRMSGSHEFFDYQYLHTNTEYNKGVVKEIKKDGTIILANNQVLTMAGIEFNENYNGEIHNFIKPGQRITYRTEKDVINDPTGDGVVRNAAVYIGNENINKKLMDMGVAERDMTDTSAIGNLATVSSTQETWGAVQEIIAHARIPFVHNKLLHIETPLESFISEQVYGANFQTWDHPIEGFIKPMINETMGHSLTRRAMARAYREFHYSKITTMNNIGFGNKATKLLSGAVYATLDPMAMMVGSLNWMKRLNDGKIGKGNNPLGAWSSGAKLGGQIGDIMWAYQQADNPLEGAIAFGALAGDLYRKLDFGEFAEKVLKKSVDLKGAMAIGAGIGLGVSALKNADWDKERMFGPFKPKKYKKVNELNEYFDRLEYIKYKGLYESASRKAAILEKSNIKAIFKDIDKNKEKIEKLKRKAEKLLKKYNENDSAYKVKVAEINQKIASLQEQGNHVFKGGKYTKAAVAYKKAMESTIYGLKPGATKDEILAAIPDQYKDYFQKFMDVRDKSERKKILKYLPDYLKRPLQLAWGMELSDVESNRKYFKAHKLPGVTWRGWKPNVNLKYVKMKTVENEGMLLADFGFYESEKAKMTYKLAPEIENYDEPNRFSMFSSIRLVSEMKGLGLGITNISIDRTSAPGIWVAGDIKQSIGERTELATNSLGNAIQSIASNFY